MKSTSQSGIKGIYTFSVFDAGNKMVRTLSEKLKKATSKMEFSSILQEMQSFLLEKTAKENVVCKGWRTNIAYACQEAGTIPSNQNIRISHFAVGTSGTTPTENDTALGNEVFRNAISTQSYSDDTMYNAGVILADEGNGYTYTEAGIFSGEGNVLSSRVLVSPSFIKTSQKVLVMEATHQFLSA